jgi:hypothetical protein
MSQENVEVLRRMAHAFPDGGPGEFRSILLASPRLEPPPDRR